MPNFYEFFAGGGMAREGLGSGWTCLFANEIDEKKAGVYEANWGRGRLKAGDVAKLKTVDVPGVADLAWASFPCQDLSLAGTGAGLRGERSGTFWSFWNLIRALDDEGRSPRTVVLENVSGALSSHGGRDFSAIGDALAERGYRFGSLLVDAVHFVPQSRPRLFIIGVKQEAEIPSSLISDVPDLLWHPDHLLSAFEMLSRRAQGAWVWWKLPRPPIRASVLSDLIEEDPQGVAWHTPEETRRLLSLMSPLNRRKVEKAKKLQWRVVGGVYRRTRRDEHGNRVQRAEVRFDDVSGCLRTPLGGSSRQTLLIVEGTRVRSRLLSPREAARLMGLPEGYKLPTNYNEAYHLAGDGVVVPVVRFLAENILEPISGLTASGTTIAA